VATAWGETEEAVLEQLRYPVAAPVPTRYERRGKRVVDVVGASLVLLLALPLLICVLVAVRLTLGPGVVLRQPRVGRDGRTFEMLKVRTMREDRRRGGAAIDFPDRRRTHKHPDDPRHTPVGRFLRRLSLDELPQLVNVIRGDMSLVGPRPELVHVAREQGLLDHARHRVRPGMTGPWQVSAQRVEARITDGLELDVDYVSDVTLRRDLAVLARTVVIIFRPSGC
jgi:lipopolysaccharide/colanic/teichoic acid biosynthesis glycosyltransferase